MVAQKSTLGSSLGIFSVIWIIVTSGGVFFYSDVTTNFVLVFGAFLVLVQFIALRKTLLSGFYSPTNLFLVMCLCIVLSVFFNSDYSSLLSYARIILVIALALGTSLLMENEQIVGVFVRVVLVLAVIALVFFYSEVVDRNAELFPVIEFHGWRYYNAFVYLFFPGEERRNLSIFVEPGLYQIYLNLALFAILFAQKDFRYKRLAVAVLLISIYSTNSTTGIIIGAIIVAGKVFSVNVSRAQLFARVAIILFIISVVGVVLSSDFFTTNIEEKFESTKQKSFDTRLNSTIIDLIIISENPLSGGGAGSYQSTIDSYDDTDLAVDAATNTFTQLGALVGIPLVLLIMWRVSIYVARLEVSRAARFIFFGVFVICFSTEPFLYFPFFYLPVFMSFRTGRTSYDGDSRGGVPGIGFSAGRVESNRARVS